MEEEENVEGAKGIRRRKGDKKEKRGERQGKEEERRGGRWEKKGSFRPLAEATTSLLDIHPLLHSQY